MISLQHYGRVYWFSLYLEEYLNFASHWRDLDDLFQRYWYVDLSQDIICINIQVNITSLWKSGWLCLEDLGLLGGACGTLFLVYSYIPISLILSLDSSSKLFITSIISLLVASLLLSSSYSHVILRHTWGDIAKIWFMASKTFTWSSSLLFLPQSCSQCESL